MSKAVISYIRVSTGKQGKSGLGIEAQREAVAGYLPGEGRTGGGHQPGDHCEPDTSSSRHAHAPTQANDRESMATRPRTAQLSI